MATPYPFPSNVHILSCVTLKLNDGNYLLWKTQIESLLSSQKLIGFVNGAVTSPPATLTVVRDGVNTDQLVRSWLFGTLSEEVLGYVHNLSTAREIWMCLAENFNISSLARECTLRRNLQLLTNKGKTLAVYSREFKTLCDALRSIGKPIDESMKIFGYLNGLGREYDPITTGVHSLTKFPQPTFNDVVSEIQGFDSRLKKPLSLLTLRIILSRTNLLKSSSPLVQANIRIRGEEEGLVTIEVVVAIHQEVEGLRSISLPQPTLVIDQCVRSAVELVTRR